MRFKNCVPPRCNILSDVYHRSPAVLRRPVELQRTVRTGTGPVAEQSAAAAQ